MSSPTAQQMMSDSEEKSSPTTRSQSKVAANAKSTEQGTSKRRQSPRKLQSKKEKKGSPSNGVKSKAAAKVDKPRNKITHYFASRENESPASSMGMSNSKDMRQFSSDEEDTPTMQNSNAKLNNESPTRKKTSSHAPKREHSISSGDDNGHTSGDPSTSDTSKTKSVNSRSKAVGNVLQKDEGKTQQRGEHILTTDAAENGSGEDEATLPLDTQEQTMDEDQDGYQTDPCSEMTEDYSMEMDADAGLHGASSASSSKKSPITSWGLKKQRPRMISQWSDRDTRHYRHGYPGKTDDASIDANYRFYANKSQSRPNGDYVEMIHRNWWGDYGLLERHHGYIQWLFPIREGGMNYQAQELQLHEIKKITENPQLQERVLTSYRLMLDFYGMQLADPETGRVQRAKHWEERFRHLNRSYHNYLRITRILKCLGELGYERFQAPLVHFFLKESLQECTLPNAADSCLDYWVHVIRDDDDRKAELKYAERLVNGR